jgi:histidinol-phosphatase
MDADLALALELADTADEITMRHFRSVDLLVESKPDTTPVTEADRSVERVVRERLAGARPGDAVVGEEYGTVGSSARRWIVDPVDGTKNFIRGVPVWATLIALQNNGRGVVGVVSAPALHRRWWAALGLGAFADGVPIHVSKVAALGDAHFSYSSLTGWAEQHRLDGFLELSAAAWRTRGFGDFWSHMLVAEGGADIAAEPEVSVWDLAALQVIVEQAGGTFTDLSGNPTCEGGSAVSSNGLMHDEVLRLLAPRPPTGGAH